jgi:uncharacterized membrane protein
MRIFGHPVHPMLVHFPIAFWTVATVAYLWVASGAGELVIVIAKVANSAGLIMAILAMLAGLLELRSIDSDSDAMRIAIWHMMIMAIVWVCFLLALMLSISTALDHAAVQVGEAACAGVGFLLMAVGGWFGGRLIYEFGIAVRKDT